MAKTKENSDKKTKTLKRSKPVQVNLGVVSGPPHGNLGTHVEAGAHPAGQRVQPALLSAVSAAPSKLSSQLFIVCISNFACEIAP